MFWRFNYLSSDIDTLLDKENVTLQEILNEDDVLQECKAQNKKLVDFLILPQHLEQLVCYVTEEPAAELAEKAKYRYPNIACELLTSDVSQITDSLVNDQRLLDKIMTFIETDKLLNPLQTSFFGKVVGLLITRKSEVIVEYLKAHSAYVDSVLNHLGTSAIMDMLLRLVTSMESTECRTNCIAFLMEQGLVAKLVGLVDASKSAEANVNAAQALCDLISIGREQIVQMGDQAAPDPLLAEIESPQTVSLLLTHMFNSTEPVESVIVSGLQVIQTLLEFRKSAPLESFTESLIMPAENVERFSQAINNTVQALVPHLKSFHRLLLSPPKQHYIPMPWTLGVLEHPLGNTRLQTAKLIATLLGSNSTAVNEELASLGTISILLDLYFEYSWNNFLHRQVELCLSAILMNDSSDNLLLTQLITSHQLIEKIAKAFDDNQQRQSTAGGCRQGYMGHLTRIANNLINNTVNSKNSQRIDDLILGLPEDVRENWEKCKSGPLTEINKRNLCDLVSNVSISMSGAEDDDFSRIAFPQSNVAQKFGYNEDDFNENEDDDNIGFGESRLSLSPGSGNNDASAAMFEDKCTRMGQYDHGDVGDTNGDEDLWVDKEITFSPTADTSLQPTRTATGQMVVSDPDTDEDEEEADKRRSSDSDEDELSSLPRIEQLPEPAKPTIAEDMDVSNADDWAKFDEVPMEVAADAPPAWIAAPPPVETAAEPDSSWANFDAPSTEPVKPAVESGWADFTSFSRLDSGSKAESDPVCTSPVTTPPSRIAAYVVPSSDDAAVDSAEFASSFAAPCPGSGSGQPRSAADGIAGVQGVALTSTAAENGPS